MQVEQDRRGHDGDDPERGLVADAVGQQRGHHPVGRRQPERAAAGKAEPVDPRGRLSRRQDVELPGANGGPRQPHRAAGPLVEAKDGHPRLGGLVGRVAGPHARNRRHRWIHLASAWLTFGR